MKAFFIVKAVREDITRHNMVLNEDLLLSWIRRASNPAALISYFPDRLVDERDRVIEEIDNAINALGLGDGVSLKEKVNRLRKARMARKN